MSHDKHDYHHYETDEEEQDYDELNQQIQAWYLDTNEPVSVQELEQLGIKVWLVHSKRRAQEIISKYEETLLDKESTVIISKMETPEMRLQELTVEHLHENDEIRFVLQGSGYLDVRDAEDRWIRYHMKRFHLSVVPTGIYHRFLLDDNLNFRAIRFWNNGMTAERKAFHREESSTDVLPARQHYVKQYLTKKVNKKQANADDDDDGGGGSASSSSSSESSSIANPSIPTAA